MEHLSAATGTPLVMNCGILSFALHVHEQQEANAELLYNMRVCPIEASSP